MGARVALACAALAVLAVAPAAAEADGRRLTLLTGGVTNADAHAVGVSDDGSAVIFLTLEDLPGTGDTDGRPDLYRARSGRITLLTGSDPTTPMYSAPRFHAASADGDRVVFESSDDVDGTGDRDGLPDTYRVERDGTITLLTGSTPASAGGSSVLTVGASSDVSRVIVQTEEALSGEDRDGLADLYRLGDGHVDLLTSGASTPANAGWAWTAFRAASEDASTVFIVAAEDLPGTGDTDGMMDVYASRSGTIRLLTGSRPSATRADWAGFEGASPDGRWLVWSTSERVPGTGDHDDHLDLYRTHVDAPDAPVLLTGSLPSTEGGHAPSFRSISSDGCRVVFTTFEAVPGSGDHDELEDVYRAGEESCDRQDRATRPRLLSGSLPVGSGGQSISAVQGTSDLGTVFFAAQEDVPGTGDTDGLTDVHRSDGRTIEVLTGVRPQASGGQPVTGFHATGTASSVLFSTAEDVPGTGDADGLDDWFLAGPDETVLLTGSNPRRTGGQHVFAAHPVRAGDRFLFTTDEAIPGSGDRDGAHDVYLSTPLAAPPPPQPPAGVSQAGGGGRESSGADAGANTPSTPPAGPPRDATAPRFSRPLRLHRTRFRFGLTEPATVTITVTRERPGRRVGGRCRVPTRRTRRAPRCVRLVAVGRLRHEAPAGASTVRFDARVAARRRLRPGRYRATAVARDAAGNASQARVRFVIRAAGG